MPGMATNKDPTWGDRVLAWWRNIWPTPKERDSVEGLVRTYGNWLFAMASGLSVSSEALEEIAARLRRMLSEPAPDLPEILAVETELVRALPPEIARRSYWEFRTRFEQVATPAELAAYHASNPPRQPNTAAASGGPGSIDEADILVLVSHIHRSYLLMVLREQAVRDLKRWIQVGLGRGLLVFGAIVVALFILSESTEAPDDIIYFAIGILLLYLLGRFGAATSVVQRLQVAVRECDKDPFFEVTALCAGRRGISIAMMTGGIFAMLLYVIFAAGLAQQLGMSGGIFPEVEKNSPADKARDRSADSGGDRDSSAGDTRGGNGNAGSDSAAPGRCCVVLVERSADGRTVAVPIGAPTAPLAAQNAGAGTATLPAALPQVGPKRPDRAASRSGVRKSTEKGPSTKEEACLSNASFCIPAFVSDLGRYLGFRDYPDFFKMLVLAFLAGFAERLVPDAIDRLVQRRTASARLPAAAPPDSALA